MHHARPLERARIVAMLVAITSLSQFFRVSNGVIGPEVMRDLAMTPQALGYAGAAFFVALAVMQVPVGLLFDRIGPRRTVAWLSVLAVAGALLNAAAGSATQLYLARFVTGVGCAASFMAAVLLASRWFPPRRYTAILGVIFAASNLGTLLGSTPLAAVTEWIGWRAAFVGAAVLAGAAGLGVLALVRDHPPGAGPAPRTAPALREVLAGLAQVLRTPGLPRVFVMHLFVYASMVTVLGVWAGPYLNDVHGLDPVARGNVHLLMGAAQVLGILCVGPLDGILDSRKKVVVPGVALTVTLLAALALVPDPPAWLATTLLVAVCFVTSYGIVVVAHGRSLFPDHLAGRGVTTVNLSQAIGTALLPAATGALVGAFPVTASGAVPEAGYRLAFGFMAALLAACVLVYRGAPDSRPGSTADPGAGSARA